MRTRFTSMDRRQRTGITAQALKMIERHPQEMRHGKFDWVCVKHHRYNILRLIVFFDRALQHIRNAQLTFRKRLALHNAGRMGNIARMTASFDHGRHWYFLAIGGDVQQELRSMFAQLGGGEAIAFEHQKVLQLVQPEGDFRCSFLLRNEQFVASYPLVLDGYGWPLRIHDTLTWPAAVP